MATGDGGRTGDEALHGLEGVALVGVLATTVVGRGSDLGSSTGGGFKKGWLKNTSNSNRSLASRFNSPTKRSVRAGEVPGGILE